MTFQCYFCGHIGYKIRALASQIRFKCYGYDKEVLECLNCGLVQLYPTWTDEEMRCLYDKYSLKKDFDNYKPKNEPHNYIKGMIEGKKRILEIGCGRGHDLRRYKEKGYNIVGIDSDPSVCDGEVILNCNFEDFHLDAKYDFIYAIHVFEHIKKTNAFIDMLKRNLSEGGEFALEIPNINDPLLSLYNNSSYKSFYWYPFHTYYYCPETIRTLFNVNGIEIQITLMQRYGLLNHLRWLIFGSPGNCNCHIPVLDTVYKMWLTKMIKVSDTMLIRGKK